MVVRGMILVHSFPTAINTVMVRIELGIYLFGLAP